MASTVRDKLMRDTIAAFEESASIADSGADDVIRGRDSAFRRAMAYLFEVCLDSERAKAGSGWAEFRERVIGLMRRNGWAFHNYIDATTEASLHSSVDGWDSWTSACRRRSSVQFVMDEFDGAALLYAGDYDVELLREADEELRERAHRVSPLPDDLLPPGIPETHWWWLSPGNP